MELIRAIKKDVELAEEIDALSIDAKRARIWWLGQSGYLLQWNNIRVLIDPYLSDSLTLKYGNTEKPHVRMSERVIDPVLLRNISIVTSSHNHTDHLDGITLKAVLANNPGLRMVIPEANREFVAARIECDKGFPIGINDGESITIDDFLIHGIPAKHNEIERDASGHCLYMGYVFEFGGMRIYHSGDTLWFDELVSTLEPFHVNLALLPINGNDPLRKVAGNLNTEEAARLGKAIGADCVIPCHYDLFTFNTADAGEFEKIAKEIGQSYKVLRGGEYYELPGNN